MAGAGHGQEHQFTGWQKTFNTVTPRGRLHCGYAAIAFWTSLFVFIKFRPGKSKTKEIKAAN